MVPGGIRMGTPALTSRGFVEEDFAKVADYFDKAVTIALKVKSEAQGNGSYKFRNCELELYLPLD
jgi:glycine hydroxymethyltransferase